MMIARLLAATFFGLFAATASAQTPAPVTSKPSVIDMLLANCAAPRAIIGSAAGPICSNVAITNPGSLATLTLGSGKTVTISNTLTFTGTDGSTLNIGSGGTLGTGAYVNTGTSGGTVPLLNAANTWSLAQTFTTAPVFTDQSGSRTALGLGALATVTPGTGVGTALAVNIGTAGSFVVNGGALGSPSSAGTIPAFTQGGNISGGGFQHNNIVIGASTPLAGTFTTLVGTTVNGNTITTGTGTLTLAASKILTANNTLTLTGTDGTTVPFGTHTRCVILSTGAATCSNGGSQANNGTYTTPANVKALMIRMAGAGGGGGGGGTGSPTAGGAGGAATFSTFTANGGAGGGVAGSNAAAGGTATGGSVNITGGSGIQSAVGGPPAAPGCSSPFGGAGTGNNVNTTSSFSNAALNSGSGGGAGGSSAGAVVGNSGACGGYLEGIITSPAATYSYALGAGGTAGAAGTSGFIGGVGGTPILIIDELSQ